MQGKRYTEEQIIRILKAGEAGRKAKYCGLEVSEAKRPRALVPLARLCARCSRGSRC